MALRITKPSDWEPYKDEVLNLFYHEGWTQKRIMEHMQEKYGLKATPRQYRTLREKSGKWKNIPTATWVHIVKHVERRRQAGKDSHVYWHQEKLDRERLEREQKRKRPLHRNSPAMACEFLGIRTPSPMSMTPPHLPNEATSPAGLIQEDVNVDDDGSFYVPSAAMSEHDYGQMDTLVWDKLVYGIPVFGRAITFFPGLCGRPEQHMVFPWSSIPKQLDYSWSWEALRCILADDRLRASRQHVPGFPKTNTDLQGCSSPDILNIAINFIINQHSLLNHDQVLNWIVAKRNRRILQSILEAQHQRSNSLACAIMVTLSRKVHWDRWPSLGDSQTEVMNMCYHSIKSSITRRMVLKELSNLLHWVIRFPLPEVVSDLFEQGDVKTVLLREQSEFDIHPSNLPVLQRLLGDKICMQTQFEKWANFYASKYNTGHIPQPRLDRLPSYIALGVDLDRVVKETWPFTVAQMLVVQWAELRQTILSLTKSRLTLGLGNCLGHVKEAGRLFPLSPVENELLLLLAARLNHLGLAEALIKSGTNPACDMAIVTLKKESKNDQNGLARGRYVQTPMGWAIKHRNSAMVQLFLETGYEGPLDALLEVYMRRCEEVSFFSSLADTLQRSGWKSQPIVSRCLLAWAMVKADFGLLDSLIESGIDLNQGSPLYHWEQGSELTPLVFALINCNIHMTEYLWNHGARFHRQVSSSGAFELCISCLYTHSRFPQHMRKKVEFLLEKGANPHALFAGETPLQILFGQALFGQSLIGLQRYTGQAMEDPRLLRSVLDTAGLLLSKGVDIDSKDSDHDTPVQRAAATGNFAGVRFLVHHGADVNLPDRAITLGRSPLSRLCRLEPISQCFSEQLSTIEFLLQNGAEIHQDTPGGESDAFFAACEAGRLDILQLLVRYGAVVKPQAAGSETLCPYMVAACWPSPYDLNSSAVDVVRFLIDSGLDVNCVSSIGEFALQNACARGNFGLVLLLLTAGADPNYRARKIQGRKNSCLLVAMRWGYYDILKLLLNAGATVGFDDAIAEARQNGTFHITQLLLSHKNQTVELLPGSDIAGDGSSLSETGLVGGRDSHMY